MRNFKKIICSILVLAFVLNHTALAVNGIQNEIKQNTQEQVQNTQDSGQNKEENNQKDDETQKPEELKLESDKYIIVEEENQIRRVLPETQIGVLKKKFNIPSSAVKVYKDETCKEEVTSGYVGTGMILTYEGSSKKYTILVIGDFNQDGKMGEIELNLLIKHIVGLKENQLQGLNKISADINGDGKINQVDITVLIRWIVYKEIDIPENKTPGAPEIQVVEGGEEKEGWYKQNVTLKILENVNTGIKVDKTTYQINKGKETKIENGGNILLEEEGIYEITAYTYSEAGAKSKAAKKTIRIEKNIEKLEAKTNSKTSKITTKVEAKSLSGIKEYTYFLGTIQEDGKINYAEGVTVEEPEYTFDKLSQNTQYSIKVEVVTIAGNTKQIEVKETTKKMVEVEKQDFTIEKEPTTWTKDHVTLIIDTIHEDYQIAYSTDEGQNWKIYTKEEKAKIEQNGQVQIRLTDGTNHSNNITEIIENIDKTKPEGNLKVTNRKTDQITVEVEAQDKQSGIEGYRYFVGTKNEQTEEISYEEKSKITEETTFTYKGLKASSTYYLKVEVIDKVGNIAEIIKEETTKDMPEVEENQIRLEYSNTEWTNQDVIVSIVAAEELSIGACKIEYSLDDGKTWIPDNKQDIVIKENTNIIVKITDGTNDVVVASGKVGNIDKQKPEGKIEETHTTKSIKAVIEAADNLSGIKGYTYYLGVQNDQIGAVEYTKKTEQVQDAEYTYENLKQDTTYYINVEIEDNAGNILTIEKEVRTEKVPDLNDSNIKTEVSETEWTKQDVIVTAFLEENLDTKGCYLEYSLDGGKNWSEYNEKIVVEHNTTVQIRLTDGLNHGQEVRVEITNIDKTAPEITNIVVDKTSRTITAKVEATDTLSGIASYTYYLGTKNEQTGEIEYVKKAETEKISYKYENLSQDTTYYIKVEVTDNIGNVGESTKEEKTIKIPDAAEYISMTPSTKKWTNQDVVVTITYEENPYQVEYSVDGENWTACENETEVIIEENKTVYTRLTDGLNHSKQASLAIENIDKQLPQVVNFQTKEIYSDGVNLEVEAADNLSGISSITWYYKKEAEESYKREVKTYVPEGELQTGGLELTEGKEYRKLEKGTYEFYADICDVAGNRVQTEVRKVVLKTVDDLNSGNVVFSYMPSTWTNGNVEVRISTTVEEYTLEYSIDGENWQEGKKVSMEKNGDIYARLTDGTNVGEYITGRIENIDTTKPEVGTIEIDERTSQKLTVSLEMQDKQSGLGKIDWYYRKVTDANYTKQIEELKQLNGSEKGDTTKQTKTFTLNNIESGTYLIYAEVYDVAGNKVGTQIATTQTDKVPDAQKALEMTPSTTNWTNQDVIVEISNKADVSLDGSYQIQYSKNGKDWTDGNKVTMTGNGTVYARLTDGENTGEMASLTIVNIDKTMPEVDEIVIKEITTHGFTLEIEVQDRVSGLGKIDWFYKKDTETEYTKKTEEYQTVGGDVVGQRSKTKKTVTIESLPNGTYDIYADVYDVAGNKVATQKVSAKLKWVSDLTSANTTFKITPSTWTNQDVTVEIITTVTESRMQYSFDGNNWSNGNTVTMSSNGVIYARLTDGENIGGSISATITNIDKKLAEIGKLEVTKKTSKELTVSLEVQDTDSGLGKIDWYYKKGSDAKYTKKTDEYTPLNGTAKGDTTKQTKTLSLNNIESGTYAVYADVYDVAGNKVVAEVLIAETDKIPSGQASLTMTPNITNWTNQDITVTITKTQSNYTVQYSKDGNTWTNGTSVSVSSNGTIYARLTDGTNVGEVASLSITNIDKTLPTATAITIKETTTEGFTVNTQVQDSLSGLGKIDWFYKLKTDASYTKKTQEYQTIGGTATGDQSKVEKSIKIDNLPYGTYQIYADVYDVAGNKKTTAVVEITLRKVTDLIAANTTFKVTPTTWTNQDVTVEITTTVAEYEMQYSKDGNNWSNGNIVTVEKNGTVYARLTDGKNTGASVSKAINNIDKDPAVVGKLQATTKTSKAITVSLEVQDTLSGLGKIDWYYKKAADASYTKKTDSYTALNGATKGDTTKQTKTLSLSNIASGTYSIYADVYDVAGNKVTTENLITQTDMIPNGIASLTMTPNITNWTNQNVTVTITRTQSSYTVQYSKDGNTWTTGTSVSVSSNGTVYARLTDGTNVGEVASLSITNIDKTLPTATAITIKETTTEGFTVSSQVQDSLSGLGKIDWFYKLKTDASYTKKTAEYQTIGGTATGDQSKVEKSITIDNLPYGTYQIYADVYDVAGNKKTTAVVEITLRKVTDLIAANTTFKVTPTTWTNQDVTVEITTTVEGYEMQYSKDGNNWSNGNIVTVEKNGTVYARLTDGKNTGASVSKAINNIDKDPAVVGKLQATTKTSKAITVSLEVQDTLSGLGKIDWYYKKAADASYTKKTDSYTALNGATKGDTTKQTKTLSLSNIQTGTYIIYADVYDVAGNKVTTENLITDTDKVPDGIAALNMTPSTTNWTNQNVTVTITRTQSSYTVQYSTNGTTWTNGTSVSMSSNGTVYARLTDGTNVGEVASLSLTNIDKTIPTVGTMTSQNITSNSLGAKVEVQDSLSGLGKIDWFYKKTVDASYTKKTEEYQVINGSNVGSQVKSVKELSLENLQQGTYQIYADVYDVAGNKKTSNTITVTTKTIDTLVGNVTFNQNPTAWTKDNVTVSIATTIKDYSLQYSTNGTTWYPYNGPVILQNNGNVYARLTDGTNEGASASLSVTNIDKTAPTIGTVTGSTAAGNTGTITVSQIADSQSGIEAISFSKTAGAYNWEYTSSASYTKTITGASSNGTWYVYARDKVGNVSAAKTTTVSGIVDKVSNVNLRTTDIELDVGGTKQIEVTYNGTAKTVTYVSGDTSIATINTSGVVTGIDSGTTNVTVRITDYDGTITEKTARVQVKSYKVTYDYITNGGTFGTKTQEEVAYGENIDLNAAATKEGWEFVGWNTDKTAKTALGSLQMPKGNITVYAIFKKEVGVTCYYYNGTASTNTTVKGTMYNRDTSVSVTMPSITSVSKNSLTWAGRGWSTATTGNASINLAAGAKVNISGGEKYYASYSTTVTATYNYYSGSTAASSKPTATAYMNYAGTLIGGKPTTPTAPAVSGYTQRGWSTSSAYNGSVVTPGAITANISYYMSYTNSITVTFNANGGEGEAENQSGTGYMTYNGTKTGIGVTMPETAGFTKLHNDISGWNTNAAGTGTNYTVGTSVTFTANTTLYAKWTLKGYWVVNNTKYYNSLSEAVTGASSGNTIELLGTHTDSAGEITISKNLTINLSDYQVMMTRRINISSGYTVNIEGNEDGKIYSNYSTGSGGDYSTITNSGTLNVKSGTIAFTRSSASVDHIAIYNTSSGKLNISGGIVERSNPHSSILGIAVKNYGTMIMTGGAVKATGAQYGVYNGGTATITVTNGEIRSDKYGIYYGSKVTVNEGAVVQGNSYAIYRVDTTVINGGTVQGNSYGIDTSGEVTISGGIVKGTNYGVNTTGKTTINGGQIVGGNNYGINTSGELIVNNGTITGKTNGIQTTGTTATIKKGSITGNTYGIQYAKTTKLIIGESGTDLSDELVVTGGTYGIYGTDTRHVYEYYNGTIISTSNKSSNTVATYRKTGYAPETILNSSTNKYETRLISMDSTYYYAIGTTGYATIQEAIDAWNTGDVITVLRAQTISDEVIINKNIIINLNNLTVTKSSSSMIVQEGNTFTVKGQGTMKTSSSIHTIENNGTINVETDTGGKITNTYSNKAAINNLGTININSIDESINGSTYGIYNDGEGKVNVKEGTVYGSTQGIYNNSTGLISVTGGKVDGSTYGIYNNLAEGVIEVNGGTVHATTTAIYLQAGTLNLKSGTVQFKNSYGVYCTSGTINMTKGYIEYEKWDDGSTAAIYNDTGTVTITAGSLYGGKYGIYHNGAGNITINNVKITTNYYHSSYEYSGIYNKGAGTVLIKNIDINANGYGIYNESSGNVTVLKGDILGNNNSAIQNYGTLVLGDKTTAYSATSLEIESHSGYGVYSSKNYEFNNGSIRGTRSTPYTTEKIQFRDGYTAAEITSVDAYCAFENCSVTSVYELKLTPAVSTLTSGAFATLAAMFH